MYPKLFLFAWFLLSWLPIQAQKDGKAKSILEGMGKKYKNIPHFKVTFNVEQINTLDNTTSSFKGEAKVKGTKYYLKTDEQEIYNDGKNVWTYLRSENEVSITLYEPDENEINLNNFHTFYEKNFKYAWVEQIKENGKTFDVIDLVPENTKSLYYRIRLTIDANTKELKSWKIFEKNGRHYLYTITQFDQTCKITDADFVFDEKKYPKVEVVDLR
ncbi:MAG: outer membrane lipoprotein carrier protein LolA [Flammeovirgaceae bacterium]|nr:outer membrane lipoprotein carrier protein LolA [Flammeovirgaceae bacterium]MDW8288104.1 outer membrane lipoprotein carrier protein LolA [Flammeovirgaceae bacterium]